eukprot:CAMPEP_0181320450 /NCGR_PEP_ID=MMETSP1101-20121128/18131_1 /TAXON_ID=46948 /ORGANISM="Rhodomonas abbreviata, Strain Caron Lab Isolate" /LENGTH=75 /DNA_ID=CAMNT_0023428157 /DNA_START=310 /DNA_END=537 /DNA_ORIENTATION=-
MWSQGRSDRGRERMTASSREEKNQRTGCPSEKRIVSGIVHLNTWRRTWLLLMLMLRSEMMELQARVSFQRRRVFS